MSSDRLQRTLGVLLLAVTDLKVLGGVKKNGARDDQAPTLSTGIQVTRNQDRNDWAPTLNTRHIWNHIKAAWWDVE